MREIITEFLRDFDILGFKEVTSCPHGQAFVSLESIFDTDELVGNSPLSYDDVAIVFENMIRV